MMNITKVASALEIWSHLPCGEWAGVAGYMTPTITSKHIHDSDKTKPPPLRPYN